MARTLNYDATLYYHEYKTNTSVNGIVNVRVNVCVNACNTNISIECSVKRQAESLDYLAGWHFLASFI